MEISEDGIAYGFGWFSLSPMLSSDKNNKLSAFPDEFQVWLDYSEPVNMFYFTDAPAQEVSRRILIATVKNKNVI